MRANAHRECSECPHQTGRLEGIRRDVTHAVVYNLFNLQRHLASAALHRLRRARAFECWNEAVAA
jgi:hypothetical protein